MSFPLVTPRTRYVHVDHLGSVDALTDEQGKGEDPRSYDPFGARRNPVWGQPVPASFASLTTLGFTGHESDDELGLVNMKGRVFDPKVGRFLTTDPIVSAPLSGQSWNPYSYVGNNPLNYVDPSGFQEEPSAPPTEIYKVDSGISADLHLDVIFYHRPREASPSQAAEVGAEVPPVDVGTTGSASGSVPQPVTTAPTDWSANPYVQVEGGFVAGAVLGAVPFAGLGYTFLDEAKVLPPSTAEARRGLAVGQIFIGAALIVGGVTGEVFGGLMTVTGIGSLVGVPAIAVSAVLVTGGAANVLAGLHGLMTTGSGFTGSGGRVTEDQLTSNAARRKVMREQDIPTSQQPTAQAQNESGRSYEYELPKARGGVETKSVQQQTLDSSHPGQGHWEAGSIKTDPITGKVRTNNYGRPKLTNDKSKAYYQ